MNDLQGVAFGERGGVVALARNDFAISFDNDPARPDLQLVE